MIFRRVVGNLGRQDWTAVVVELVVVIAGVFIGLQPPNWNENLRTDEKSADFTQRLRAGLREEAWAYEYEIAYSDEVIANAKRTADALSGAVPSSDEALPATAYRATQYIFNASRRATYDELTSTGEIGLIRDPTLRDLAMRLYTMPIFNRIFDEGENNPYRKAFRMAIRTRSRKARRELRRPRRAARRLQEFPNSLDYPCSPKLPREAVAASAAVLRRDPQFLQLVRLRIADVGTNQDNLKIYYPDVHGGLQALARSMQ